MGGAGGAAAKARTQGAQHSRTAAAEDPRTVTRVRAASPTKYAAPPLPSAAEPEIATSVRATGPEEAYTAPPCKSERLSVIVTDCSSPLPSATAPPNCGGPAGTGETR